MAGHIGDKDIVRIKVIDVGVTNSKTIGSRFNPG